MALMTAEIKAQGVLIQKKKLDVVMKKTQDIIDSMLPKQIATVSKKWNYSEKKHAKKFIWEVLDENKIIYTKYIFR